MHPSGADLELLARLIDAKEIAVVVDKVFPFAESREALAYLEQGRAKGKVVVQVADGETTPLSPSAHRARPRVAAPPTA
jgi:alcohol dehydrogenase